MKKFVLTLMILLMPCYGWGGIHTDGVDDKAILNTSSFSSYPISISTWVKRTNGSAVLSLLDKDVNNKYIQLLATPTGAIVARNTSYISAAGTTTITNTWVNLIGIWRSATDRELYINGTSEATSTTSVTFPPVDRISIGILDRLTPADALEADISYVAVWTATLTANDISLLANSRVKTLPCQIQPSNLVDVWELNECADGVSCDGMTFRSTCGSGGNDVVADAGADSSLVGVAEEALTYP